MVDSTTRRHALAVFQKTGVAVFWVLCGLAYVCAGLAILFLCWFAANTPDASQEVFWLSLAAWVGLAFVGCGIILLFE